MVKNQPTMQETQVQSLGQEDQLEKGMATHFQYSCLENIQVVKEEVKLSLYEADMLLYIENPKNATRKLLELINESGKLLGYKINT